MDSSSNSGAAKQSSDRRASSQRSHPEPSPQTNNKPELAYHFALRSLLSGIRTSDNNHSATQPASGTEHIDPHASTSRTRALDNISEAEDVAAPEAEPLPAAGHDAHDQDFLHEPVLAQSNVYGPQIDNWSDLDPMDPDSLRRFRARIGPSVSASESDSFFVSPENRNPERDYEAVPVRMPRREEREWDADDEGSLYSSRMESPPFQGLSHGPSSLSLSNYSGEETDIARMVALDPETDHRAVHPAPARRHGLPGNTLSLSYDSDYSAPLHFTSRDFSTQFQGSDEETPDDQHAKPERSILGRFLQRPPIGSVEYFENHAGSSHYREAAELFAVDPATGQFSNPFAEMTNVVGGGGRGMEGDSPLTRSTDFGRVEDWTIGVSQRHEQSPASSLADYGQFEGLELVSPPSDHITGGERRFPAPVIDSRRNSFLCPSPASSYTSDPSTCSFSELDRQLAELHFDIAAHIFFSAINVDGLLADQNSGKYTLEDHDEPGVEYEYPFYHFLSHSVASLVGFQDDDEANCPCFECSQQDWPHVFDRFCSCLDCQDELYQEIMEMHALARRRARDSEELEK